MIDCLAGMTDRFAIRAWTERAVPAGRSRRLSGALHATTRRSASATRSTWSSSSARAPSCAVPAQRRYTGLCPFHEERTPSFGIDPVEKLYHCFGCGEGGDAFRFVMETEGLDFSRRAGVAGRALRRRARGRGGGPAGRGAPRARASGCSKLLERTAAYYERVLWESPEAADAREYLAGARAGGGDAARVPGRLLARARGTAC